MTTDIDPANDFTAFEERLRDACHAVIPHLMDAPASTLRDGADDGEPAAVAWQTDVQRRPGAHAARRSASIAAVLVLLAGATIAYAAISSRHRSAEPAQRDPATSTTSPTQGTLSCDDAGCAGFDRLPVVPGSTDYYLGPEDLGEPDVALDYFENLTRCAELEATASACAKVEGIAGVNLVTYWPDSGTTPDTSTRSLGSYAVNVGTTFTDVSPADYARSWGPMQGGGTMADVTVRGHAAIRYLNEAAPGVVWQERPGVLVWVNVPPDMVDDLMTIAEGVRITTGPDTIPDRVNVDTGGVWDAGNNDGPGIVFAKANGVECFGLHFVDACGQTIELRTVVQSDGFGSTIAGSAPGDVTRVDLELSDGSTQQVATKPVAGFTSRAYQSAFSGLRIDRVHWVGADGSYVATMSVTADRSADEPTTSTTTTGIVAATVPSMVIPGVLVIDGSGTPGLVEQFVAYLADNGVAAAGVLPAASVIEQTMLQPIVVESGAAERVNVFLGVGGFDTFTPSEIDGALPKGTTVVITLGADGGPPQFRDRVASTSG